MRLVKDNLENAVETVLEASGHVIDPDVQKELLLSAQFGKSFLYGGCQKIADRYAQMAVDLRILNSLRNANVGIALSLTQFKTLTMEVVIDRLLARRLYPLAIHIAKALKMPKEKGENRILGELHERKVIEGKNKIT